MYRHQLNSEINKLQEKYVRDFRSGSKVSNRIGYRPFLGIISFDEIDDTAKAYRKQIKETLQTSKLNCGQDKNGFIWQEEIHFFIVNSALSKEMGEHWFLMAFCPSDKMKLFVFNTYGAAHTAKILGYGLHINDGDRSDEISKNRTQYKKKRCSILFDLVKEVWPKESSPSYEHVLIVDLKSSHQDASTDECGYHVYRFVHDLFKYTIFSEARKIEYQKGEKGCLNLTCPIWKDILKNYIIRHSIITVHYQKGRPREETQPLLLKNDRTVRAQLEDISLDSHYRIKNRENIIEKHEEYDLTDTEWYNFFDSIALSYNLYVQPNITFADKKDLVIEFFLRSPKDATMTRYSKQQKKKLRKKSKKQRTSTKGNPTPYFNPISKRINAAPDETVEEEFERLYAEHTASKSKKLIESLFPNHRGVISNQTPILQKQKPATDDPHFLDNIYIHCPGDLLSKKSIRSYYNEMGVKDLDESDPYTYILAMLTRDYFNNHSERSSGDRIRAKVNARAAMIWKHVS